MENNPISNTTSFMSSSAGMANGLGPDVAAAIARRQTSPGGNALAQNSQNPQTLPSPAPSGAPQPPMGAAPQGMPAPMGGAVDPVNEQLILRALDTKLKSISKIQETAAGVR